MNIEITNFDLKQLGECVKAFPEGIVKVIDGKAYWVTTSGFPKREIPISYAPANKQVSKNGDFFTNMRNQLFEAFSP